ncbi:MAG: hypothetical protein ACTSWW_10785 [Promethearchaeota archaeon]
MKIIDLYPKFRILWDQIKDLSVDQQIEHWQKELLSSSQESKELCAMLITNYEEDGEDWQKIATQHVFPKFPEAVPQMIEIHANLLKVLNPIWKEAKMQFNLSFDIKFILYVGIGVGAGWAVQFQDTQAVLFGLENIVECGWKDENTLAALTAHEIGHLIHQNWRSKAKLPVLGTSPFWQLYEEGFAMRLEHKIMGKNSWHEQTGQKAGWLEWCSSHKAWLAEKFLAQVQSSSKKVIQDFFGSWFKIEGYTQTGYYLGHEIIIELEKDYTLLGIANLSLSQVDSEVVRILKEKKDK